MFLDVASKDLLFMRKETSLLVGTMWQGEGGLFVYTCFIDVSPKCVNVLEFVLDDFLFGEGVVSSYDSRLVASWNLNRSFYFVFLGDWVGKFWLDLGN